MGRRLWVLGLFLGAALGLGAAKTELHVGAVFPETAESGGWAGGEACLPAAQMALREVNKAEVLGDYELVMHHFDSGCQPGLGGKRLYDLLYNPPTKMMILSGCSLVTTLIAETAHLWNLIVLSYGASSPALSNRQRFPTLFRTHPSATFHNPARVALFQKFGWKKVAILQSVQEVFTSTAKDLERQSQAAGISVSTRQSFLGDPSNAVANLARQDPRIIVGLFYETEARRVFCQVYKEGLYGRRYVWFLIGWYSDAWWVPVAGEGLNCTREQMEEAAAFHLTTEAVMLSSSNSSNSTRVGKTGPEFQDELRSLLPKAGNVTTGFVEAPLAYDAIWALALAVRCTVESLKPTGKRLEDFNYGDETIAAHLQSCMNLTDFPGVSGTVQFSETGDRIMLTQIEQMREGQYVQVGTYDAEAAAASRLSVDAGPGIRFAGGKAPPDSTPTRRVNKVVGGKMYIGVGVLSALSVLLCLAALAFNFKFANRRIVQESLPACNSTMMVGCVLSLLSLFLMGLPAEGVGMGGKRSFELLCHARATLLSLGFSLGFGAAFAKVWLVHRRGAPGNADGNQVNATMTLVEMVARTVGRFDPDMQRAKDEREAAARRRAHKATQAVSAGEWGWVVGFLVALDVGVGLAWLGMDPMQRSAKLFPMEKPTRESLFDWNTLPVLEVCRSAGWPRVWTGLTLGTKAVLLVLGLFLAYEGRRLNLRHANDSRFLSMAVYNVGILCLVTGPVVTFLIPEELGAAFAFVAATTLVCCLFTTGLLFLPKALYVYRVPASEAEREGRAAAQPQAAEPSPRPLSKDEQRLLGELRAEHEDVLRQIRDKEAKIAEVKVILAQRRAAKAKAKDAKASASAALPGPPQTLTTEASVERASDSGYRSSLVSVLPQPLKPSLPSPTHHHPLIANYDTDVLL